jgi:hypothetical protein
MYLRTFYHLKSNLHTLPHIPFSNRINQYRPDNKESSKSKANIKGLRLTRKQYGVGGDEPNWYVIDTVIPQAERSDLPIRTTVSFYTLLPGEVLLL